MTASTLQLSIAFPSNERTRPLADGRVVPKGIRLIPTYLHPSEMFWRQLRYAEFDISEMSLSSLTIAVSQGDTRWVAIPVFTVRRFFHAAILVNKNAGIEQPADLKGKRVGVPEYQQTAALWARGALQHEFGVHQRDMQWFMERGDDKSHGTSTGFKPPEGVKITTIPSNDNIGAMLQRGDLDATVHYIVDNNLVDRSRLQVSEMTNVRTLFKDPEAEKRRYYAKTGIFPINHTIVVRRSLLEQYPWIALNMFTAFVEAKALAESEANAVLGGWFESGLIGSDVKQALKKDPKPYGFKSSRLVVDTITQYVHEQGLSEWRVTPEELFAPSTLDL